jgi:hypothetical protein
MSTTPVYAMTEWSAAQASPWVPENAAKRVLEAVGRGSVADRDLTAPPGSCDDGACYLIAATATDAWASHDGEMAIAIGIDAANGWLFVTIATEGQFLWIEDEAIRIQYASGSWAEVSLGVTIDTDGTLAANSDMRVASQKATKTYVDTALASAGLDVSWKAPVRAATTSAGTLASDYADGDTLDGVTLTTGDAILIKDQADASENGIYEVAASGAPSRRSDADTGADLVGAAVIILEGTTNGDTFWFCETNPPITLGTTDLTFAQLTSGSFTAAAAADIWAGTSTTKTVTPKSLADAAVPQVLTDGATISWDMADGYNARVTIGGARTLDAPTNMQEGWTYVLEVIQDATGGRTMTWPASFNWGAAGAPTLSTAANKVDLVTLYCRDAATPKFRAVFNKDA